MDAATPACAPSGVAWDGISWADVQRQVRRLQARIVKWTQAGRHNMIWSPKSGRHEVDNEPCGGSHEIRTESEVYGAVSHGGG